MLLGELKLFHALHSEGLSLQRKKLSAFLTLGLFGCRSWWPPSCFSCLVPNTPLWKQIRRCVAEKSCLHSLCYLRGVLNEVALNQSWILNFLTHTLKSG